MSVLTVRVTPRAARDGLDRFEDGVLHVRVTATVAPSFTKKPRTSSAQGARIVRRMTFARRHQSTTISLTRTMLKRTGQEYRLDEDTVLRAITIRRAEVLRELADARTEREIATTLGMSVDGVRAHVQRLRLLTGCDGVRALGRWWRERRHRWVETLAAAAGDGGSIGSGE